MARQDIVIVGAARTAVGAFNGAFVNTPAHDLGAVAIKAALERAKVDVADVDEVILGQVLTAAQGQNPARQAAIARRHPEERDRLGPQPGLRLGPARRRHRRAADRERRRRRDRGRRPGIDVDGASRRPYARRHQDGRREVHRHDAQGRPAGRLQRLPHGHHRRERRPEMADLPRGAGPASRSPRRTRPRRPRRPAASRTRSRR